MSVLFTVPVPPSGVVLHVLQIRNRTAFLARELGLAAGASDDARGFLDNIVREWAASLEEDDDVAQLVGAELDVLKREVPLPADTTMELFATGAERVLTLSRLRHSRSLILFLHAEVLSRVLTLHDPDDGGQNGAPASPGSTAGRAAPKPAASPTPNPAEASPTMLWTYLIVGLSEVADKQERTVAASERLCRSVVAFDAINKLAEELVHYDIGDDAYCKLRWEAVEELLGRRLRTPFPAELESEDEAFAS